MIPFKNPARRRLLVECTYVFEHPQDNSGIQRVVRNVIKNLGSAQHLAHCVPVVFLNGTMYEVVSLTPGNAAPSLMAQLNRWRIRFASLHSRYWNVHNVLSNKLPPAARRIFRVLFKLGSYPVRLPGKMLEFSRQVDMLPDRVKPLVPQQGDTLVLLDSSWHGDFFEPVKALKSAGLRVINVVYDLIPITHPQFCDAGLVRVFEQWVEWMTQTGDGYVCISETISHQLRQFIAEKSSPDIAASKWYRHFRLGSDLDLKENNSKTAELVVKAFDDDAPSYVMVSTLEPRKNHAYLLDAFEILWKQGRSSRLVIIGKIGWKVDALIERIRSHAEFGSRLFMFNGLGDSDLEFAYRKSKALLFPSFVEGFGLPIVEAMQRNVPTMVSDIPVFHEIAGDHAAYFDLARPETLAGLVEEFETSGIFPARKSVSGFVWLSWKESTLEFVSEILSGLQQKEHHQTGERH